MKYVCECCGKELKGDFVGLELNSDTGAYSDPRKTKVPADQSQGLFFFGNACARQVLKNGGKMNRKKK